MIFRVLTPMGISINTSKSKGLGLSRSTCFMLYKHTPWVWRWPCWQLLDLNWNVLESLLKKAGAIAFNRSSSSCNKTVTTSSTKKKLFATLPIFMGRRGQFSNLSYLDPTNPVSHWLTHQCNVTYTTHLHQSHRKYHHCCGYWYHEKKAWSE